jgi:hypothetical protein
METVMTRTIPAALAGTTVVEFVRPGADRVVAVAVAFAGLLAASFGATVVRLLPDGEDPSADWGPPLPGGGGALAAFLHRDKLKARAAPREGADLVTDDPELAAAWTAGAIVLVEPRRDAAARAESELTILAASGLLDIFGAPGRPPLPLPGHQMAYCAGTAAFDALVSAAFQRLAGRPASNARVPILDVAVWLNWKHYLAAHLGEPAAGIGRAEDWASYRCLDGHVAIVFQDKDLGKLAALTGEPQLAEARFASRDARRRNIAAFREILAGWAGAQRRDDVSAAAARLGIPIGPVLSVGELLCDRQMSARGFIELAAGAPGYGMPALPARVKRAS